MSYIKTAERFNASHSVIVRLKQRVNQTGSVKEHQRTGKPLKTTPKEDRLLKRLTRQWPFSTANTLRSRWIVNRRISRRTLVVYGDGQSRICEGSMRIEPLRMTGRDVTGSDVSHVTGSDHVRKYVLRMRNRQLTISALVGHFDRK